MPASSKHRHTEYLKAKRCVQREKAGDEETDNTQREKEKNKLARIKQQDSQ